MAITKVSRGLLSTGISDNSDATAITISSDENVGIKTTSPIYDLQIGAYGTDADSSLAIATATDGSGNIRFGDGTSGVDANQGKISTRGWLKQSDIKATDLIKEFSDLEISNFIVTDISTDGTLNGPNESFIEDVLNNTNIPVIASGGIGSLSDLLSLTKYENVGLDGVIVGKALYENKFTIKEAQDILSSKRLGDFPNNNDIYA